MTSAPLHPHLRAITTGGGHLFHPSQPNFTRITSLKKPKDDQFDMSKDLLALIPKVKPDRYTFGELAQAIEAEEEFLSSGMEGSVESPGALDVASGSSPPSKAQRDKEVLGRLLAATEQLSDPAGRRRPEKKPRSIRGTVMQFMKDPEAAITCLTEEGGELAQEWKVPDSLRAYVEVSKRVGAEDSPTPMVLEPMSQRDLDVVGRLIQSSLFDESQKFQAAMIAEAKASPFPLVYWLGVLDGMRRKTMGSQGQRIRDLETLVKKAIDDMTRLTSTLKVVSKAGESTAKTQTDLTERLSKLLKELETRSIEHTQASGSASTSSLRPKSPRRGRSRSRRPKIDYWSKLREEDKEDVRAQLGPDYRSWVSLVRSGTDPAVAFAQLTEQPLPDK